ncbi:hypothetical protein P2318_34160 [Myxococcaceae bacterium GXIMD 01537]
MTHDNGVAESLPPAPEQMVGRESPLDELTSSLLIDLTPPTLIRGPEGIGKSALALAALHDARAVAHFGSRRFFVRCDTCRDVDALVSETASRVGLPVGPQLQQRLLAELTREPALLVLDDVTHLDALESFFRELSEVPRLARVATLRGEAHPPAPVEWNTLELGPLGARESRDLFLAIAGETFGTDPLLERTMDALGGVPLALELLAHAVRGAPSLERTWEAWRQKRAEHPERALEAVFEHCLADERLTADASRLIAFLSQFPAGLDEERLAQIEDAMHASESAALLKSLGLAFTDEHRSLRLPAAVRSYAARHHPPSEDDLGDLSRWFVGLAQHQGELFPEGGSLWLHREFTNLVPQIERGLEGAEPQAAINAARALNDYLSLARQGPPGLLYGALEAARRTGDGLSEANCHRSLGVFHLQRHQQDEARDAFRESLRVYRQHEIPVGEALALRELGDLAYMRFQPDEARLAFEEAAPLFQQAERAEDQGHCLAMLGRLALQRSAPEESHRLLTEALSLLQQAEDAVGEADCLQALGDVALHRSANEEAHDFFQRALALFRRLGIGLGEANCLLFLGRLAALRSQRDEAEGLLTESQQRYREAGNDLGRANCLQALGEVALARTRSKEADALLREALALFGQMGHVLGRANCLHSLGKAVLLDGPTDEVQALFEEALSLYREVGNVAGEAHCLQSLGEFADRRFEHEKARGLLQQALPLFERLGNLQGQANCLATLGDIALYTQVLDEAEGLLQDALRLRRRIGDSLGAAMNLRSLSDLARRRSQPAETKRLLLEALDVVRGIPDPHWMGMFHRYLVDHAASPEEREEHIRLAREAWIQHGDMGLVRQHDAQYASDKAS